MIPSEELRTEVDRRFDEYLETLFTLLRQPSISAQGVGVNECAGLVVDVLQKSGIDARILETEGSPVAYGEVGDENAPFTLLVYGHYDVQPPEPLDAWESPPFEPTIRDGRIYARGVGDNKGQFLSSILAFKLLSELGHAPGIKIRFLIEGEEENGSRNLRAFVNANKDLLSADAFFAADGPMHPSERPVVCFGVRGMVAAEVKVRGANRDLHSGNWGGPVPNGAWKLVELLSTMRTPDGRAAIEGFYDGVKSPTEFERALLAEIPFDEDGTRKHLGIETFDGPADLSYYEKIMFQPTLTIAGLQSGYTGSGKKSVIPSEAVVRLECRLVPDQKPDQVLQAIEQHIRMYVPDAEITLLAGQPPSKTSPELPVCRLVVSSMEEAYGIPPVVMPLLGATAPNYVFTDDLGLPAIWTTYANYDEDNHAPNENMTLQAFRDGIVASAVLFQRLSASEDL
jgi:acetylornithine deacetylase/succinyl-diaminopimelate desuccinylase-like protein